MTLLEGLEKRCSVRRYEERPVSREDMDLLLHAAVRAATGSGQQPWGFVVINGRETLDGYSETIKAYLKEHLAEFPYLQRYESWMTNPKFHVFNRAHTALAIYGSKDSHWRVYDCSMAAGNVMLAGLERGIGSCWIGFAESLFGAEAFKTAHGVPAEYELVATLSLGYWKDGVLPAPTPRREPVLFFETEEEG